MRDHKRSLHHDLFPGQEITKPELDRGVCILCGADGFGEVLARDGALRCFECIALIAGDSEDPMTTALEAAGSEEL